MSLHIKAHRTFMSSALVKTNPMAVVKFVSHINQHVSLLATQMSIKLSLKKQKNYENNLVIKCHQRNTSITNAKRYMLIDEQIKKLQNKW